MLKQSVWQRNDSKISPRGGWKVNGSKIRSLLPPKMGLHLVKGDGNERTEKGRNF